MKFLLFSLITKEYENIVYLGENTITECRERCNQLGGFLPMVIDVAIVYYS